MNLRNAFLDIVKSRTSSSALFIQGESFTYKDLADESEKEAIRQRSCGFVPGHVFISERPNGLELLSEFFACVLNGLVFCPVYERKTAIEKNKIRLELEGKKMSDLSGVVFQSSGSTGEAKYIFQSFDNILENARISSQYQSLSKNTRAYSALPFSHTGGMNMQALPTLLSGGTLVWERCFTAPQAMLALKNASTAVIVPTQLEALFRHSEWKSFRPNENMHIVTGSMSVSKNIFKNLNDKGIKVLNVYGLTEVGPFVSVQKAWSPLSSKALSGLGYPLPQYNVSLDPNTSEILITGKCVGKQVETSNKRELTLKEMSVVATGDIGLFDRGELFFCGRLKRRINTSGMKYSPEEVEMTLKGHPGVYDAYVSKKRSRVFGEIGVAYIEGDAKASSLREFLRARLSSYKIPREFKWVEKLERSDIEKPRARD